MSFFLVYYLLAHSRDFFRSLTNLLGTLETIFKGLKHRKDLSIRKSNGTDFSTSMVIHLCTSVFHVELFMNGSVRCSIFSCFSYDFLNFLVNNSVRVKIEFVFTILQLKALMLGTYLIFMCKKVKIKGILLYVQCI